MKNYEKNGVLSLKDLKLPSEKQLQKGVAIIECIQKIPCNPCVDSCPMKAIYMRDINDLPVVDYDKCIGCAKCISICPGLAIFVVKKIRSKAMVSLPYEFLPVPIIEQKVKALNRKGEKIGDAVVKKVIKKGKTMVITVEVDEKIAMNTRNIKVEI